MGSRGKSHSQVQPWASKQTCLSCFKLFLRGRCWTNCLFSVSSLPLCSMTKIPEGSPAGVSARDGVGGSMLHHQCPSSSRPGDPLRRCLKHTELKENHSTPCTPPQMVRYRLAGNSLKTCPPDPVFSSAASQSLTERRRGPRRAPGFRNGKYPKETSGGDNTSLSLLHACQEVPSWSHLEWFVYIGGWHLLAQESIHRPAWWAHRQCHP